MTNLNSMKGFFSARGQGIRSGGGGGPQSNNASHEITGKGTSQMQGSRGNQLVNSQNGQIQGMFSPRRNIMSGSNNNGQSFIGMR